MNSFYVNLQAELAEAKEEQEKNIGAKESKMAALDENPAVDIQNKGTENRAYSDKSLSLIHI